MKLFFVLLILGVTNSFSHQEENIKQINSDVLTINNSHSTIVTTASVASNDNKNNGENSFDVQPSSRYQYNSKDEENIQKNILSSLNSKIPSVLPSENITSWYTKNSEFGKSQQVASGESVTQRQTPFNPSHYVGYNSNVKNQNVKSADTRPQQYEQINNNRFSQPYQNIAGHGYSKSFPSNGGYFAQRRNDPQITDDSYAEDSHNGDSGNNEYESYGAPQIPSIYGIPKPEVRESGFGGGGFGGGFGGSGSGFEGPAAFDPLPPPPQPIKGSVDYILIPLVLIGLAGPIFVVLYVILGAFEAKLSPIQRSLGGFDAYKPYLDSVTSAVGRALDKNECLDYAACQLGSFCNRMGYTNDPTIKRTLESFTPSAYRRTVRKLFDSISDVKDCSIKKCLTF